VAGPEVLGGGPDRDRTALLPERVRRATATARRRRWTGLAATVLVAVAAGVLAVRSRPERAALPPPTPAPTFAPESLRLVADVAVGSQYGYALVASCLGPEATRLCRYRLFRRSLGGGSWTPTVLETGQVAGATGPARLFVAADDQVTVVDQPTVGHVYTSPDAGRTVTVHPLSPGPPVAAVLDGWFVDQSLCESCLDRLTVLEPRTGRLHPLAAPPPLGSTPGVRTVTRSGSVLWALGDGGSRLLSAVSLDRGRTWRRLPVGGARAPAELVWLVSDGGRGAYLLIGRDSRPDVLAEFSELWRVGDPTRPGAAWRQVTPAVRPPSAAGLVAGERGLIVVEESGMLWRLVADGTLARLPEADYDGLPIPAGRPVTGPGRVLLAVPLNRTDFGLPVVLFSPDEGETWRVELIRS